MGRAQGGVLGASGLCAETRGARASAGESSPGERLLSGIARLRADRSGGPGGKGEARELKRLVAELSGDGALPAWARALPADPRCGPALALRALHILDQERRLLAGADEVPASLRSFHLRAQAQVADSITALHESPSALGRALGTALRCSMLTASLAQADTRELTRELQEPSRRAGELLDDAGLAHREAVALAVPAEGFYALFGDHQGGADPEWELLYLTSDAAADIVALHAQGGAHPLLVHEKIHTGQDAVKAYPPFELEVWEGTTEALTEHVLRRAGLPYPPPGEDYGRLVRAVGELARAYAERPPQAREPSADDEFSFRFLSELSAVPTGARTAWLAQRLYGAADGERAGEHFEFTFKRLLDGEPLRSVEDAWSSRAAASRPARTASAPKRSPRRRAVSSTAGAQPRSSQVTHSGSPAKR